MVYKKIQNKEGNYTDAQHTRFDVLEAHEAYTPQGINAAWDTFENLEAALEAYGLIYNPLPEGEKCQPNN